MPLRGGSKSIPLKNILEIEGKPLFAWALESAVVSGCFDTILVATDSAQIKEAVQNWFGDQVTVVSRTKYSATHTAATELVMMEVCMKFDFSVMSLIQATSPLTKPEHFSEAKSIFIEKSLDSLFTGVEKKSFYWSYKNQPLNYQPTKRPRRQDFEGCIEENGAFYFTKKEILRGYQSRLGGKIGHYLMPESTAVELDEPADVEVIAGLLSKMKRSS